MRSSRAAERGRVRQDRARRRLGRRPDLLDLTEARDESGPELALQIPLYPDAAMPFETAAGSENVSGAASGHGILLFVWSLLCQKPTTRKSRDYSGLRHGIIQMTAHPKAWRAAIKAIDGRIPAASTIPAECA